MTTISPANFSYKDSAGDLGQVKSLSTTDITLLNDALQDVEDLKLAIQKPLPPGSIIHFAGATIPTGFLICNGIAVSRTTYANLYAAIGTLYGAGDGSTTFNLPDARDRVLQGASSTYAVGTSIAAGLPNIYGTNSPGIVVNSSGAVNGLMTATSGAFSPTDSSSKCFFFSHAGTTSVAVDRGSILDASTYNDIYSGSATTVQPPAVSSYILIKV